MKQAATHNGVTLFAYQGDAATLLAFDLTDDLITDDFVGFTVTFRNPAGTTFPIMNRLGFSVLPTGTFISTEQAPLQIFSWIHIPGTLHGNINDPIYGNYTYFLTPRYFDKTANKLKLLDSALTVQLTLPVEPFQSGSLKIGFTRGYVVSQAYIAHFGDTSNLLPSDGTLEENLQLDLSTKINTKFSYNDQHTWLGFNAFKLIMELLTEVETDNSLTIDVFAYDLDNVEIVRKLLAIAQTNRIRIILDDSTQKNPKTGEIKGHGTPDSNETHFATLLSNLAGAQNIVRGNFSRLAHDKIFIIKKQGQPIKVLTGSTNFSMNGLFINANHVLVFDNPVIAHTYATVFNSCFSSAGIDNFSNTTLASQSFSFNEVGLPPISITFSPHKKTVAASILDDISAQIKTSKSVFFAVMDLSGGGNLIATLKAVQDNPAIFSYGITDSATSIHLLQPGENHGILVTGKPKAPDVLPPPFTKEVKVNAHEIHHKFLVLDFNKPASARVYCGSSNFSLGGEQQNGDNLLQIQSEDIAIVFTIEAMRLIDHYEFRNRLAQNPANNQPQTIKKTFADWGKDTYQNPNDYHFLRRKLLAS